MASEPGGPLTAIGAWITGVLGVGVRRFVALTGGDIHRAHRVECADGRVVFVKWNVRTLRGMFAAEARGLKWLRDARAIAVPDVLGWVEGLAVSADSSRRGEAPGRATDAGLSALLLEYVASVTPTTGHWEALGHQLAALHQSGAPTFGATDANFIGTLPQDNTPTPTWASFFIERRLEPQFRRAVDSRKAPARWLACLPQLYQRARDLIVEPAYPERLHGDLWSGNVVMSAAQGPVLVDPAAYGGHGEVDLALMRLFGGFEPRVYAAYAEARSPAEGVEERLRLYQLYPLLVHANLFGGSYVASVDALVRALS